jgi:hypothetical protein
MPANCPVRDDIIVSSLTSFPTAFWKLYSNVIYRKLDVYGSVINDSLCLLV